MSTRGPRPTKRSVAGLVLAAAVGLACAGCQRPHGDLQTDSPQLAAYVQLIMPRSIELQPYWTKPVSFSGDTDADGLEIILAAYDSFGDNTKIVGRLQFELFTRRAASADRLGQRVALWTVALTSKESLTRHWDPFAHFYRFDVRLAEPPLPPGRYILVARLQAPNGERLFDEYEFTYEAGTAAPVQVRE